LARDTLRMAEPWPQADQSPATSALRDALITDPARVPPQTREKLRLLVGRYLPVPTDS
jgi:hypothetical protein